MTFIGVFACLLAAVEVDLSGGRGIAADIAYLAEVSRTNVLAARFPMDNGSMACPPQAKRGYRQFFLRDYAYVLEGCADVLPEKDLLDAARLFLMAISPEGAGCDFVDRSGWYNYRPGGGTIGENPVVDGTPFTVAVEYLTWRQTRAAELLDSAVLDKLAWAMEKGVPRNPETGLVHIAPRAGTVTLATKLDRAPYGFTDVVRKQGDVLFGSLLYCEAAIRLAEMFNAAGHPAEAEKWRRTAQTVKDGINKTLWDEKTDLYLAASHTCRQADVWGSAFAIWIGVADAMRADRISRTLVGHYDGIVQNGQVRHLLPGDYWQLADAPRDTYQNGGFWGTASGWVANAIARTDLPLARRMLADLVRFYREKGVPEWSIDGVGKGHLELEGYLASTTVPLAVFRRLFAGAVLSASSSHAAAYDIVIYGSTPAAISAAVQAKRSGKSVVVVSPETRIGGMTTGGLGQTDGANLSCYGGIAREFYRAVKAHYDKPESWTRQTKKSYSGFAWAGKDGASADTMWTFEPSAALAILEGWEKRDGLEIHRGKRLDRSAGKVKANEEESSPSSPRTGRSMEARCSLTRHTRAT